MLVCVVINYGGTRHERGWSSNRRSDPAHVCCRHQVDPGSSVQHHKYKSHIRTFRYAYSIPTFTSDGRVASNASRSSSSASAAATTTAPDALPPVGCPPLAPASPAAEGQEARGSPAFVSSSPPSVMLSVLATVPFWPFSAGGVRFSPPFVAGGFGSGLSLHVLRRVQLAQRAISNLLNTSARLHMNRHGARFQVLTVSTAPSTEHT